MNRLTKPLWNSLLGLNLVMLSAGTPIVLAEPTAPVITSVAPTAPAEVTQPAPSRETTDKPETTSSPILKGIIRQQKLMEADRLYLEGQFAAAEKIYREVKAPFAKKAKTRQRPEPIVDPAQLSPAGKVYWREAEAGRVQKIQTRVMVPLRLLVEQYPEFVPGNLRLAQALQEYDHDKESQSARFS